MPIPAVPISPWTAVSRMSGRVIPASRPGSDRPRGSRTSTQMYRAPNAAGSARSKLACCQPSRSASVATMIGASANPMLLPMRGYPRPSRVPAETGGR